MNRKVGLLLGAGFSYPAGLPLMKDLGLNLEKELSGESLSIYQSIHQIVPEIENDFELCIEVCHDLKETSISLIKRFFSAQPQLKQLEELVQKAEILYPLLINFLRKSCTTHRKKLNYLYPLGEWLKKSGFSLDIFSLNYDLIIESLCEEYFISYTDGFSNEWSPQLFQQPNFQIYLYKLHGSFIWYQLNSGRRIKIPIIDQGQPLKYLAYDPLHTLLVYPRRYKREPFVQLFQIFRERLLILEKLIIIGYSFRDPELKRIIEDGMAKNAQLKIEVVTPHAKDLINDLGWQGRVTPLSKGVEEWVISLDKHLTQ